MVRLRWLNRVLLAWTDGVRCIEAKAHMVGLRVKTICRCHGHPAITIHSFGQVEPAHQKEGASDAYADTSPEDRTLPVPGRQEARFVGRPVSGKVYSYR
jgi:hypothetical protein